MRRLKAAWSGAEEVLVKVKCAGQFSSFASGADVAGSRNFLSRSTGHDKLSRLLSLSLPIVQP